MMNTQIPCPVCGGVSAPLDVVDFNKSCEELRGKFLPLSGIPIYYYQCGSCQFCFAPEFASWGFKDFEEKIYNQDYIQIDPDYLEVRPRNNAGSLVSMFGERGPGIRHLDFGGGIGLMSKLLREEANWQSTSFDPFVNKDVDPATLGQFDLITVFEVFEHVPNVGELVKTLSSLLVPDGIVLFCTLMSDGNIVPGQRLCWWYASPRNGHISLFSRQSLKLLGAKVGFKGGSFSDDFHVFWKQVPPWASHMIQVD